MSQALLHVDQNGRASINAAAIMDNALKLVLETTPDDELNSDTICTHIEEVHASLLSIVSKLVDNGMIGSQIEVAATKSLELTEAAPSAAVVEMRPSEEMTSQVMKLLAPVELPATTPASITPDPTPRSNTFKRRQSDKRKPAQTRRLPRRLSRIEDALKMDTLICLEDGKKVKDLGKHLETIGVSPAEYLRKWNLPSCYPMKAPSLIQKRGFEYEYDPVRGRMIKT